MRLLPEIFHGEPASGAELARRLGIAQSTVAREMSRHEESGLVELRSVGAAKIAVPAESLPFVSALRQLLAYVGGVVPVLVAEYGDREEIEEVFIFGSWADRVNGVAGPPPNDIDVAVVSSTLSRFDLAEAQLRIEAATGAKVDQFVLGPDSDRLDDLRAGSVPVLRRNR